MTKWKTDSRRTWTKT